MLVHGHAFALNRGTVEHVDVELDSRSGLPGLCVIGLGGGAARDARERVQAAVLNSGFIFPRRRLTANLAPPATSTRDSPEFDLVLACCVLAAQELVDARRLARIGLFAQLGLGGDLRACGSSADVAQAAAGAGLAGLVVARSDLREARAACSLPVAGLRSLGEVAELLAPRAAGGPARSAAARRS